MVFFQMMGRIWQLVMVVFILLSSSVHAQGINTKSLFKSNPDGSITLLNHVPKEVGLNTTSMVSHANSNQMFDLQIILPSKDPAGLDTFIKNLYNPKSPSYHKFLTSQQFAQQFGASTVDSSLIIENLKSQGLTVKSQSNNGFIITVTGLLPKVESAFKVKINNYKKTDGTMFFAPAVNPTIPLQMAGKVFAIIGLDNVARFHPHIHLKNQAVAVKAQAPVNGPKSSGKTTPSPAFSGFGGFLGPTDIKTAYNLNSVTSTGSGQTLGLFELDGYLGSDITTFENYYGLPHVTLNNVYVDGATGTPGSSTAEDVLDIDLAIAVSPGLSNIIVYQAPDTWSGWFDLWNRVAQDDLAKVVSASWGLDEPDVPSYDHTFFSQMAAQGQSVFASAGDEGAYDNCSNDSVPPSCAGQALTVDDPASDPYVTGVGISILTENGNGTYNSETASFQGGGGISADWSIPSYQVGFGGVGSLVSTTMRNVPDVVFTADPSTSYAIYVTADSGWGGWWGSSAASPIWASFLTRVNQGRTAIGQTVIGYFNPVLYQIAGSSSYTNDFHDITLGNNSFYPARTGFDDATGLGSFNGANLYNDLLGLAAPTGLIATGGNGQVGLTWTASAGAVSYNVKRSTVSGSSYATISTSGAVTVTSYTDGTVTNGQTYYYVVSAVNGLGESGNSNEASATPQVPTVPSPPTSLFAVAGNAQATVTFSGALPHGSPISAYTVTSNPDAITAPGASSPITVTGLTNGRTYTFKVTATNMIGTSVPSVASNSVTPSPVAAPSSLNGTILGAKVGGQIIYGGTSMTWKQSITPGIIKNKIYRATGAGSYALIATVSVSTSYIDKSLVKGLIYNYYVSSVGGLGESPPSNVWSVNY